MNLAGDLLKMQGIKTKKPTASYKKKAVKESVVSPDWFPICFPNMDSWKNWSSYWRSTEGKDKAPNYCEDCLPEYQSEMIRKRRCAYPGTTFHIDSDGFVCGIRPANRG